MSDTVHVSGGQPPGNFNTYAPVADPIEAAFLPGTPVTQSADDVNTAVPTTADVLDQASATGLAAGPGLENRSMLVQFLGPMTLTTAQWDAITAQSGGLTRGEAYYVGTDFGTLVAGRPGGGNVALVGVALSATTLFVRPGFVLTI